MNSIASIILSGRFMELRKVVDEEVVWIVHSCMCVCVYVADDIEKSDDKSTL